MKTRKLGIDGTDVSAIGLGCMSFAGSFGPQIKQKASNASILHVIRALLFWTQPNYMGKAILKN